MSEKGEFKVALLVKTVLLGVGMIYIKAKISRKAVFKYTTDRESI